MKRKSNGRGARWAASVVVTMSLGVGCKPPEEPHHNPPPLNPPDPTGMLPTATPTVDVTAAPTATPTATIATAAPPATATAIAVAKLRDAPGGGYVRKDPLGKCWYAPSNECPPNLACNPPPPEQVNCPASVK